MHDSLTGPVELQKAIPEPYTIVTPDTIHDKLSGLKKGIFSILGSYLESKD
jgi:hypothetical protein